MKDYITKEEFKAKLKEIIEKDQTVWHFIGALAGMIGLAFDEEVKSMSHHLIDKEMEK